ncbi:MAG: ankyrin repeat domain-containing protein [Phycisphaerales bacterium]|nr:ankyrin repeat domain-containing protein [Phycisphaerales bacterium]
MNATNANPVVPGQVWAIVARVIIDVAAVAGALIMALITSLILVGAGVIPDVAFQSVDHTGYWIVEARLAPVALSVLGIATVLLLVGFALVGAVRYWRKRGQPAPERDAPKSLRRPGCVDGLAILTVMCLCLAAVAVRGRWPCLERRIMQAAYCGDQTEVAELIRLHGVDVRLRGGTTPLAWAAAGGHPELTAYLLDHGAALEGKTKDGWTAVFYAAGAGLMEPFGSEATLRLLLDAGATVELSDHFEMTPLMWSASIGDGERTRMLMEAGADMNARGPSGRTPLMFAAGCTFICNDVTGGLDAIRVLLAAGADEGVADSTGYTALDWAQRHRDRHPEHGQVQERVEALQPHE